MNAARSGQKVCWLAIFCRGKIGGERSHKTVLKFDPFRTTRPKDRTFDFPSWLKYAFSNTGRLE